MQEIGARCWAIAEGYIPAFSNGPEPPLTSHETACILNAGADEAQVETDCASIITADVLVAVQHTRLDARQAELSLISAMPCPVK